MVKVSQNVIFKFENKSIGAETYGSQNCFISFSSKPVLLSSVFVFKVEQNLLWILRSCTYYSWNKINTFRVILTGTSAITKSLLLSIIRKIRHLQLLCSQKPIIFFRCFDPVHIILFDKKYKIKLVNSPTFRLKQNTGHLADQHFCFSRNTWLGHPEDYYLFPISKIYILQIKVSKICFT